MHEHAGLQALREPFARVVARHRTWLRNRAARKDLAVTEAEVTALFGMTQTDAARALDISVSTLQRVGGAWGSRAGASRGRRRRRRRRRWRRASSADVLIRARVQRG